MSDRTIKSAAKEAKSRLKGGFWQNHREDVIGHVDKARINGVCATDVVAYYSQKMEGKNLSQEDEFYLRVKRILDEEGEVSDMLGRLTDQSVFDTLTYSARQRYMMELSERYQRALLRYKKEKIFR